MIPLCVLAIEDESDREFMTRLYLDYHRLMYDQIVRIVRDASVTEDLLHDVLIKLIEKIDKLRDKSRNHLINYIISCCKNHSFNYLRSKKVHAEVLWDDWINIPDSEQDRDQMDFLIITKDDLSKLTLIWSKLDNRNRSLLEQYYVEEKDIREIGKELGIKSDSVRMALTRARRAAYRLMEETQ